MYETVCVVCVKCVCRGVTVEVDPVPATPARARECATTEWLARLELDALGYRKRRVSKYRLVL